MGNDFKKDDSGKVGLAYLPMDELSDIAAVLDIGAKKYERNNWRKGTSFMRVASAMLRHINAWIGGEDKDPETGKSHLAHAACNILFLMFYEKHRKEFDDREAQKVDEIGQRMAEQPQDDETDAIKIGTPLTSYALPRFIAGNGKQPL